MCAPWRAGDYSALRLPMNSASNGDATLIIWRKRFLLRCSVVSRKANSGVPSSSELP